MRNFGAQAGRVVIVGEEPLLEAVINTNRLPLLILYGQTGSSNTLLSASTLFPSAGWSNRGGIVMPDLFLRLNPGGLTNRMEFFRAVKE